MDEITFTFKIIIEYKVFPGQSSHSLSWGGGGINRELNTEYNFYTHLGDRLAMYSILTYTVLGSVCTLC